MRRMAKAAGLAAIALLVMGAAAPLGPLCTQGKTRLIAKTGRTGLLVNLNEARLWVFGGYGGERLRRGDLMPLRKIEGMGFYALKAGRAGEDGHVYVDRDGDGLMDAGAIYSTFNGVVIADWNCDGKGDQMLAELKPTS